MKRILSLLLCLTMCLSLCPADVFAEEEVAAIEDEITVEEASELSAPQLEDSIEVPDTPPDEPEVEILSDVVEDIEESVIEAEPMIETEPAPTEEPLCIIAPETELVVGETMQLSVNTSAPVTWSSSDENVLTVDETGLVTAVGTGEATVYADVNGESVSVKLSVGEILTLNAAVAQQIRVSSPYELESAHPYEDNTDCSWYYTDSDAESMTLTFDEQTETEDDYDYIYIYDGAGNQLGEYSGTALAGESIKVEGDTVCIRLTSDYSNSYYGFRVSYYSADKLTDDFPVTYDANGGTGAPETQYKKVGEELTLSLDVPTWGDGEFLGWATSEDSSEVVYQPGDKYNADEKLCLYAVWDGVIAQGICGDDLIWELDAKGTLTISGTGRMYSYCLTEKYYLNVTTAPWEQYCDSVKSVLILNGVTSIGEYAFYFCRSLTSVTIGNSVVSIGEYAFSRCGGLTSVTIPDSVMSIGNSAFLFCFSLTSVTIGNGVTSIGRLTFDACTQLAGIYVSSDNNFYCSKEGVLFNKSATTLVAYPNAHGNSYIIPNSVTSIGDYAFNGCRSLTSIEIPDSVTSIGNGAFSGCCSLTSVTIPNSVTSIGGGAFDRCSSLTSIVIPNSVTSIGYGAFYDCASLTSVTIGNSVTSIGDYAFCDCASLTSVTIGNSVTSIGNSAFFFCSGLRSIEIPDSVTSIGGGAFYNCSSLTSMTIGNSVTSIGDLAFYECDSLTSVTIGNSVTSIGVRTFYECGSLTSVTIGNSVTSIGYDAFSGCSSLTSVTIGNSVTGIGDSAFSGCSSLTSIVIPNSVTCIGGSAFSGCSSLTSVVIPDSVTSIGYDAFSGCSSLTSVTIGNSVTNIDQCTFYECSSLTSVVIPDSVTSIGVWAFYECSSLTSVTIGNSVTSIGWCAFYGCSSLSSVTIGNGVTSIGDGAFAYSSGLTSVTVGNSVTSIGDDAFYGCSSLSSVTIGNGVTSIGDDAFSGCEPDVIYYAGSEAQWASLDNRPHARKSRFVGYDKDGKRVYEENVYYNCVFDSGSSGGGGGSGGTGGTGGSKAQEEELKTKTLSVFENTKDSCESQNYIPSASAEVYCGGAKIGMTDAQGKVTISSPQSAVTISKNGFLSQTYQAEDIKSINEIYLEKNVGDTPVINALWADNGSGKPVNILLTQNTLQLYASDDTVYTLRAEVNWRSREPGKIYLKQEDIIINFDINESLTIKFTEKFDIEKPIFMYATSFDENNKNPKRAEAQLKIEAGECELDGFSFNLFNSLSISIPDSVREKFPVLPSEVSIGILNNAIPLKYAIENGKVYVSIGIYDQNSATEAKENAKNQIESVKGFARTAKDFKDSLEKGKDAVESFNRIGTLLNKFGGKVAQCKGNLVTEGNFSVIGFAEGYMDDGRFVLTESGAILIFKGSKEFTKPFVVAAGPVPVPMFFEVKLSGNIEGQLNLYINREIKAFTPQMEITGEIALSGGIGVGLKKAASVSGGLKGKLLPELHAELARIRYFRLDAALDWYLKAEILFTAYKWGGTLAKTNIIDYVPDINNSLCMTNGESVNSDRSDMHNAAAYKPSTIPHRSSALRLSPNSVSDSFIENAYSNAAPQLATFDDGTRLAVWVDVDPANQTYDGLNLYYSFFDGEWSTPKRVDNDGTMDASPSLEVINGKAYLAWQDASATVNNCANLAETAGIMGISAAVYDPDTDSFTVSAITSGGVLDMSPQICGDANAVYVVWHRNGANDWFGQNYSNSIMASSFNGTDWSAPAERLSGLAPVLGFSSCCVNGLCNVAYAMDTDCDLNTTGDVEVFVNGARQTSNDVLDSGVCYAPDGTLFWYSDGSLFVNGSVVASGLNTDRIQVVSKNGVNAVLFPQEDGLATVIYALYYSGGWGSPVPVYGAGTSISQFDADVTPDGNLTMFIKNQQIVGDFGSEDPYGECSLDWYNPPVSSNIKLNDISYDASGYLAGESMSFTLSVSNTGEVMAENINVKVTDENGNELYNKLHIVKILSGQSQELNVSVMMDDVVQGRKLTFEIGSESISETTTEDNAKTVELSWNDVSVENLRYVRLSDKTLIYASIANRGHDEQTGITVMLREDTPNGTIIETKTVDSIESFDQKTVSFALEKVKNGTYYVCIEHPEKDDCYSDDTDFLVVEGRLPGDVNADGKVNTKDFVALMRYCAGDTTVTYDPNALDIDNNGEVETLDFITLMQFIAGKDVQIY